MGTLGASEIALIVGVILVVVIASSGIGDGIRGRGSDPKKGRRDG